MAYPFLLTSEITVDLDRVLRIVPRGNGVELTFADGHMETISPIPSSDFNRLLDVWLGKTRTAVSR